MSEPRMPLDDKHGLLGKVALVTGAGKANGIGFASARRLGLMGATVVLTDMDAAGIALDERVRELEGLGVRARALRMDVSDPRSVENGIAAVVGDFGAAHVVFNNAGYAGGTGPFADIPLQSWRRTLDINLMGIVHTTRALLPVFEQCGGGVIINNASLAGLGAVPLICAYTASKFAVVGLTKALACELGSKNVRINAICPGMVWTDMGRLETELLGDAMLSEHERKEQLAREVPLGRRWAEPDEIADVVAFLASPASRYVSGAAIPVAAGLAAGL